MYICTYTSCMHVFGSYTFNAVGSPFSLKRGVVFSLSGFKNPFRGELREKAVEMGAQYQPDWNKNCTHLVLGMLSDYMHNTH